MRRAAPAGVLLCGLTSLLIACAEDAPTAASAAAGSTALAAVTSGNGNGSCNPPSHPAGTIVDTVSSPVAWGVAVRDDGLAYFTELFNGGRRNHQHEDPHRGWVHPDR